MSDVVTTIFKKIVLLIVFCTAFLGVLTKAFTFINTAISVFPVFARGFIKFGFVAFMYRLIKGVLSDE